MVTGELQKESKVLKIYGSPASSAGRCYWVLEECGVDYRACPVNMREGEHRQKWYLDINPTGKVPALEDGNLKLGESMAINTHETRAINTTRRGQSIQRDEGNQYTREQL